MVAGVSAGRGTAGSRGAGTAVGRARRTGRAGVPTLRHERSLLREGHAVVAGMDEVGRGALAGPVSVGVVLVTEATRTAPAGVKDSKLLSPAVREALVPRLRRWATASAVGHAQAWEIDAYGIIPALRLAGRRALAALPTMPDVVLLDGSHNWLAARVIELPEAPSVEDAEGVLFDVPPVVLASGAPPREPAPEIVLAGEPRVTTMVKADLRCAAVAAASVLAKVERDALMVELAATHPHFGWHENKGYAAPDHVAALREHGPCQWHRRSWNIKACAPTG